MLGVDEEVLEGYFPMFNNFQQNQSFNNYTPYNSYTANLAQQNANFNNQNFQAQINITFVNGIEGAKAFQMSPNSSALLMDSDNSKFYVKSTDSLGVAKISSYSFTEDENLCGSNQISQDTANIVQLSKEEYDSLISRVAELEVKTNELSAKLSEVL